MAQNKAIYISFQMIKKMVEIVATTLVRVDHQRVADWIAVSCDKREIIMEVAATALLPVDRLTVTNCNTAVCANFFLKFVFNF